MIKLDEWNSHCCLQGKRGINEASISFFQILNAFTLLWNDHFDSVVLCHSSVIPSGQFHVQKSGAPGRMCFVNPFSRRGRQETITVRLHRWNSARHQSYEYLINLIWSQRIIVKRNHDQNTLGTVSLWELGLADAPSALWSLRPTQDASWEREKKMSSERWES